MPLWQRSFGERRSRWERFDFSRRNSERFGAEWHATRTKKCDGFVRRQRRCLMAAKLIRQPDALPIEAHDEKSRQVAAWVLEELGTPRNLYRVDAKPLWDEYFRVNVYCRQDVGLSAKEMAVTDSFS